MTEDTKAILLPRYGEVWQGFGKTLYMCVQFQFKYSTDIALIALNNRMHKPELVELSLNQQTWEFYLKNGQLVKVADNWLDYLVMSSTHPDQEVRELFSYLMNNLKTKEYQNA